MVKRKPTAKAVTFRLSAAARETIAAFAAENEISMTEVIELWAKDAKLHPQRLGIIREQRAPADARDERGE